ncbi:hypothetical protein VIBNISFn27_100001 [Vibrio nigripulchritudo SFn27]|uniref:Uncharacterized protein n=1 Tax=Vibrio nigripulchritudo TaxID=28173 RepID=U4KBT1_9VIBR|nr:hypothetical protein [Vibrio nigripulchritudo]CCN81115.1 hypothetical protein VIBNIBLFn1_170003 [Vibrio nigripulchritudo BLFn1]CCN86229.1 hypothetical protein VIBNISFn27_100001 [Vibrio nigripulchritudo SFn27]CCN94333.1 hypothetical protein VIBNIENn2_360003 [Vibrio nigripulchritudo ENn2]CCO40377.1 hypothetical protein VIBNISFn135_370001 [Vibrio nigripulchritudo SFn135]CCO53327.1 hypothetical protein VIBNIWn13_460002 [Vibrio nigripulchritudo Wn13]
MVEYKQLLKYAKDEDDFPVSLYLAKTGVTINWKGNVPDVILYIPESIFQSVACSFIEKIGPEDYYSTTILDSSHVELLCNCTETSHFSEEYKVTLAAIKHFIESGLNKLSSHYLAFEGP